MSLMSNASAVTSYSVFNTRHNIHLCMLLLVCLPISLSVCVCLCVTCLFHFTMGLYLIQINGMEYILLGFKVVYI